LSLKKREALRAKLEELLLGIEQPHIRRIAKAFLEDNEFMANFCAAPAGVKHHHAYSGGLLEHVVQLMEVCDCLCKFYPGLHRDLLVMGAFLHDTGKVNELGYERDLFYTDSGQLLGHLILGVELLDHKIRDINEKEEEPIPEDMVAELKHLIVSHHGEYEYGSPRLPMTTEAITLHLLDNLDSKLHAFSRLMEDDPNMDSNWTGFQHSMGRKLFKSSSRSWT